MATYRVPVLEDFAWQPPVDNQVTNVSIHSDVSKGDRYIVIATASDMFEGQEDNIATATKDSTAAPSDWMFDTPVEGHVVWVKDENKQYRFDGTNWIVDDTTAAISQLLVVESEMSQVESRVLVVESEMSQQISDLLVEKSTVNDISEVLSQTIADLLVEKSTVNDVSEAVSQTMSRVLVVESEMSDVNSNLLVEKSTVNDVSEAVSQTMSRVLVLESETSALEADKQDLGIYVSEYGAIQFTA